MYIPSHFEADDEAVHQLLTRHGAADLITATPEGLIATTVPFVYDREHGTLTGHLARNNDQWSRAALGEALVIMRGPDSYITPSWYATKSEHGRVVPTWNYLTVHVYGNLASHDDPDWLETHVRRLTELHEAGRPTPWALDHAPASFISGQLRAIIGLEITITRVDAKFKLSQNRSSDDIDGVIEGLKQVGDHPGAAAVEEHRPHN